MISHFLVGRHLMSAEQQLELVGQLLNDINLENVSRYAKQSLTSGFKDILILEPEASRSKVTREMINAWADQVSGETITPYIEEKVSDILMMPPEKSISPLDEKAYKNIGVTELVYANGIRVVLKPTHLSFTKPRFDQEIAQVMLSNQAARIDSIDDSPDSYLSAQFQSLAFDNHFRARVPKLDDITSFDIKKSESIYRERFSYANDFTFVFTGSFEVNKIKPLVDQYIATLPYTEGTKKAAWVDTQIRPSKGIVRKDLHKGSTQKSSLIIQFNHKAPLSPVSRIEQQFVSQILNKMLIEKLREEMGSTYSPGVNGSMTVEPENVYQTYIEIACNPKDLEKVISASMKEIARFQTNGPKRDTFNETKKELIVAYEQGLKTNDFWHNNLLENYMNESSPDEIFHVVSVIKAASLKDIHDAANKFLNTGWYTLVTLSPEG